MCVFVQVSGLNRHARQSDVLGDSKNRLAKTFYEIIDYFLPPFILMEQVMDIFKNQDGVYGKFAMAKLVANRYQLRAGIMTAGAYGCAQVRAGNPWNRLGGVG